jgi:DNA mismatch repair protein MutS
MVSAFPSETASRAVERCSSSRAESDVLVIDAQTFRDLEVFESETGETCLFQFCNLTRNAGGAKVLRRRMERPWSNADRIRATQE